MCKLKATRPAMSQPKVTIGIPCFNCAAYLPLLINSIRAQTYSNWEVIAVDDASTDGTRDILQAINDPRFHVHLGHENQGLSFRLNQIARLARGSLLARTDADDVILPHRIERQVRKFLEEPTLDVVSSGCYVIDNANRLRGVRRIPELARDAREVMLRNGPSHPTVMSTTSWAQRNLYRCEQRRGEDLDLWIRTVEHSRMHCIPEPLHVIREDMAFDQHKYQRTIREHRDVVRKYLGSMHDPLLALRVELRLLTREWSYRAAAVTGLASSMAARRNAPVGPETRREIEDWLSSLKKGKCAYPQVSTQPSYSLGG